MAKILDIPLYLRLNEKKLFALWRHSMKKRREWTTREKKRACRRKNDKGIVDVFKIIMHFFKPLTEWIMEMKDPRHPSYITYTQADLVYVGILKNLCSVESMRQMTDLFNEDACISAIPLLSGNWDISEMPHGDTLNFYLERLSPECLSELRRKMVKELLKSRRFHRFRLLGKYWRVVMDGTGLFHFREKHCGNCLVRTVKDENGKERKDYYHKVLEAKILFSDSLVISLGTEFIENENEDVEKQDCENAAAKRLLARIKKEYPRLNICVFGDGLYGVEPLMKQCRGYGWKYIFNLKEGTQRNVTADYRDLESDMKHASKNLCGENGTGEFYNAVGEITGKDETFNVFGYSYEKIEKGKKKTVRFLWVTNIRATQGNLEKLILAGRKRWKIENEGFNSQKNGIYKIEHLNSRNTNAMKNHYLLTQLADILMQLYLACNRLVKGIGQSIKNTSSRLLESFRRHTISDEDVNHITRYTTVHLE